MESFLIYAGLVLLLAGLLSLLKPLRFLKIRDRRAAAAVLGTGLALALLGATLPAVAVHAVGPRTRLDDFVPDYDFHEIHEVRIHAPAERIFRAVRSVTAGEIRFFRALTWIRSPRLGRGGRETILAAP